MHYQIIKNKIESYTAGTFGGTSSSALFALNIRLLARRRMFSANSALVVPVG